LAFGDQRADLLIAAERTALQAYDIEARKRLLNPGSGRAGGVYLCPLDQGKVLGDPIDKTLFFRVMCNDCNTQGLGMTAFIGFVQHQCSSAN